MASHHASFMLSTNRESEFHQNCVPKEIKEQQKATAAAAAAGTGTKHTEGEFSKCDAVTNDKVWKQCVDNEKNGAKSWDQNWGFLTEFDAKVESEEGNPKPAEEVPEKVSAFSDAVPNTNAGNYGSRLNTNLGETMQNLEFRFNSHNRKKKLGNEMICY